MIYNFPLKLTVNNQLAFSGSELVDKITVKAIQTCCLFIKISGTVYIFSHLSIMMKK